MTGASDSVRQLQLEKENLQSTLKQQGFTLSQASVELEAQRAAIESKSAATKALEAQLDAAQERGMLLERQLGMKTADWEVCTAQLDLAQKETAKLQAAEQELSEELARCAHICTNRFVSF